jgi:hypothetical protein
LFLPPQATLKALLFFYCRGTRVGIKISQVAETPVCPTGRFLKLPAKSAFKFKRLILETPLYQHLLLTMSSNPTFKLNDTECEKGHVTQRPPIPYATSKAESTMKASRETIKMKTSEGEVKVAVLGDSPGAEEYLQHQNTFTQMLVESLEGVAAVRCRCQRRRSCNLRRRRRWQVGNVKGSSDDEGRTTISH